ncbi:MAG: 3-dehydroquinate synthase [Ignavibacteriae bacterium]|nr:3-dehydroquinate synthase [Ignavibacteriota bacterium]
MRTFSVELDERRYPIYLGHGILSMFADVYRSHGLSDTVAIVSDQSVAKLYLRHFSNLLTHHGLSVHHVLMPPGERQKSIVRTNAIITKFIEEGLTRSSTVIALGGGVVGDVAGFAAAIYRRGIPIVHVPTTLLAQVESAIGGKVGVNHPESKNAFGVFHQPAFVFSDVELLRTLPDREITCGLGEMLKYALFDEQLFSFFETHLDAVQSRDIDMIEESIYHCNAVKVQLVAEDERELKPDGGRVILNLGHTIGHALETCSHYELHHGEAVLVGLRWELALALKIGLLGREDFQRINELFDRVNYRPSLETITVESIMHAMYHRSTRVRFILPKTIGDIIAVHTILPEEVRAVLGDQKSR